MKLPLFRLIHDIINENADKSLANHVGCVMAQKSPIIFSNECDRHYTIHLYAEFGKTEGTHTLMNASILLI